MLSQLNVYQNCFHFEHRCFKCVWNRTTFYDIQSVETVYFRSVNEGHRILDVQNQKPTINKKTSCALISGTASSSHETHVNFKRILC